MTFCDGTRWLRGRILGVWGVNPMNSRRQSLRLPRERGHSLSTPTCRSHRCSQVWLQFFITGGSNYGSIHICHSLPRGGRGNREIPHFLPNNNAAQFPPSSDVSHPSPKDGGVSSLSKWQQEWMVHPLIARDAEFEVIKAIPLMSLSSLIQGTHPYDLLQHWM